MALTILQWIKYIKVWKECRKKLKIWVGVGYREGNIENSKGPQWHNLNIIQGYLPVNKMKKKNKKN